MKPYTITLLLFLHCYSAPALHYVYTPGPASGYETESFANFTSLHFKTLATSPGPCEVRGLFLSREQLQQEARRLDPDFAGGRPPEVSALYIAVLNYGGAPLRWETLWLQIRDAGDDRIYRPVTTREYAATYAGYGNYPYVFEFAFAQKDSLRFSHRVPDWYASLFQRDTLAPAEDAAREENRLHRAEARHERRSVLQPGREAKALVIFPDLATGRDYVLEYRPQESRSDVRSVMMAPLRFRLDVRREDERELRKVVETEAEQEERERREERGQQMLAELRRENARDVRELYRMHEQLRRHEEIKASTTGTRSH